MRKNSEKTVVGLKDFVGTPCLVSLVLPKFLFITCARERRLFAPIDFNAKPFLTPQLV